MSEYLKQNQNKQQIKSKLPINMSMGGQLSALKQLNLKKTQSVSSNQFHHIYKQPKQPKAQELVSQASGNKNDISSSKQDSSSTAINISGATQNNNKNGSEGQKVISFQEKHQNQTIYQKRFSIGQNIINFSPKNQTKQKSTHLYNNSDFSSFRSGVCSIQTPSNTIQSAVTSSLAQSPHNGSVTCLQQDSVPLKQKGFFSPMKTFFKNSNQSDSLKQQQQTPSSQFSNTNQMQNATSSSSTKNKDLKNPIFFFPTMNKRNSKVGQISNSTTQNLVQSIINGNKVNGKINPENGLSSKSSYAIIRKGSIQQVSTLNNPDFQKEMQNEQLVNPVANHTSISNSVTPTNRNSPKNQISNQFMIETNQIRQEREQLGGKVEQLEKEKEYMMGLALHQNQIKELAIGELKRLVEDKQVIGAKEIEDYKKIIDLEADYIQECSNLATLFANTTSQKSREMSPLQKEFSDLLKSPNNQKIGSFRISLNRTSYQNYPNRKQHVDEKDDETKRNIKIVPSVLDSNTSNLLQQVGNASNSIDTQQSSLTYSQNMLTNCLKQDSNECAFEQGQKTIPKQLNPDKTAQQLQLIKQRIAIILKRCSNCPYCNKKETPQNNIPMNITRQNEIIGVLPQNQDTQETHKQSLKIK